MARVAHRNWFQKFGQQFSALFCKNGLLAWRNRRSTLLRLSSPFVFMLLVWLIDKAIQAEDRSLSQFQIIRDPDAKPVPDIPKCEKDLYIGSGCKDFMYTVEVLDASTTVEDAEEQVELIVDRIRENNNPKIPKEKVEKWPGRVELDEWLLEEPETTQGAVHFFVSDEGKKIDFTLQTNSTVKFFKGNFQHPNFFFQVPLQMAVEREIVRQHLLNSGKESVAANLEWDVAYKEFPHPAFETGSVVGSTLGPFLFAANMFGFVIQMSSMVSEKQAGMRQALRTMGMLDSTYWLSWAVWELLLIFTMSILNVVFGFIFQFKFFLNNSIFLVFWLLFLFQMAMSSLGMVFSVFLSKATSATVVGFVTFLIGWITQSVVLFGIPYSSKYFRRYGSIITIIFSALPWNLFSKGITDLGNATANDELSGLSWLERSSYCRDLRGNVACEDEAAKGVDYIDCTCVMPLSDIFGVLFALYALYFVLAVYLEKVLPNEMGMSLPPWYFLTPGYWGLGSKHILPLRSVNMVDDNGIDEDVTEEKAKMQTRLDKNTHIPQSGSDAVELFDLQKCFGSFWSIKGSWFAIEKNQLFCLLGPNGAGKTTTINCLTGVIPPSGGDALVYGESIRANGGMDRIRTMMGVCPQFDVLWEELTGEEHLRIFGHVKGLEWDAVNGEAATLLERVKLTSSGRQRSGTYSGGMKRRLSVAIALLGDPQIVYLDEPTTGMDPISRRYVWDIIESAKAGRAIVLTTHSMEEADILGDRISIMARGRIRAIGSSIRLKQKFGAGYEVSVSVGAPNGQSSTADLQSLKADGDAVKEFFRSSLNLTPREENRAYITYLIPRDLEKALPDFLNKLESEQQRLKITDVQLSLTTLEEVFLKIAREAETEAIRQTGATHMPVPFTNGVQAAVELNQDTFVMPDWGVTYKIVWGQDESGSVMIMDVIPQGEVPEGTPEPNLGALY
ncbi:hypothetical protein BSKO_01073 [Bryopsis sp. KO-2023]|nr:hypothetical protein BSKO_01073 [Bryopsis sp. KO-2023]